LPSIIPILSQGLKDPNASRRQVSFLIKYVCEILQLHQPVRGHPRMCLK
jgi:hypothetical protein